MSIDLDHQMSGEIAQAAVEQPVPVETQMEEFPMPEIPKEAPTPVADTTESPDVPKEDPQERNFRALQESIEQLKARQDAEKREYQLQLEMLRANSAPKESPKQKRMFDGMEDGDIPNVGELRRAWEDREAEYLNRIEELQVQGQHSDYAEVLQKYGTKLAQTDPLFVQGLRGAENKALFAYQYAKREQRFQELEASSKQPSQPSQPSVIAQKIVENSRKPGTLAQAGGGHGALSKADYIASMSDAEFMKYASGHLEAI